MMTTPDKLRADAAKLDVFLEMFESTYFYFLDMAEGEAEKRDRGALAFYEIKDRVHALMGENGAGKSTFIKRFMDVLVFPNMVNTYEKTRVMDELPQSGEGRTITTTEPKFIPPDAVLVSAGNGVQMKVRLVDCVGYLVPGVLGDKEEGEERMVSTPWAEEQIPFSRAAELGTEKVIHDHSVVGVVVTTDGSFGELPRENFVEAEEKTIAQLKALQKPFVVILNSANPQSQKSRELAAAMEKQYEVPVLPENCQRMSEEDFDKVLNANLKGAFLCCKEAARRMVRQRSGRIINLSSVVALRGNAGQTNYAASKAGLIGLTKSLARELASRGVTVNAVAPGFIATDMTAVLPEAVQAEMTKGIPLGRVGQPDDVANAVAFLAAEQSGYLTGQVLCVDGGMAM